MPHFNPPFAVKSLQQIAPGTPVIYQHGLAFACIHPSAPAQHRPVTLAVHDAEHGKFVYRYFEGAEPVVLVPPK